MTIQKLLTLVLTICISSVSVLFANPDQAPDRSESPYFQLTVDSNCVDALPLKHTGANVTIVGVIANVEVTQVYTNNCDQVLEATYIFPMSSNAAVHDMVMHVGGRPVYANIMKKADAQATYDQAISEGKTASLLEQHRPNVFQMSVGNIMPGDSIVVVMTYTELLVPTDGVYEFAYPTVVGPRYQTPEEMAAGTDQWTQTDYTTEGTAPTYTFSLEANIVAGMPIWDIKCESHKIVIDDRKGNEAKVRLSPTEKQGGNRDFILNYSLKGNKIESGLILYEGEEENFFLAMVQPPRTVEAEDMPPREYILIMDVSGSMYGYPLNVSKAMFMELLDGLRPEDKFNIMYFSGGNSTLFTESQFATAENIQKAKDETSMQSGGGGTQLLPALERALGMNPLSGYSRSFVIATDGYVSVEKQCFDLIAEKLGEANFFSFGIGSSPNRYIIDGIARVGMGEPFISINQQEAQENAQKMLKYIQSPVLTDIKVDYQNFQVYDLVPKAVPDVFAEKPVIIFGKYRGEASGSIQLRGVSGKNDYEVTLNVADYKSTTNTEAVKYLWARHQIAVLDDYSHVYPLPENLEEQVTELGLKYHLMTQYTSFVAVDTMVRNESGELVKVNTPLPLPQGVTNNATGNITTTSSLTSGVSASYGWSSNTPAAPASVQQGYYSYSTKSLESATLSEVSIAYESVGDLDLADVYEEISEPREFYPASYPGGNKAMKEFIEQQLQYPAKEAELGIEGKVTLKLTIDEYGSIAHIEVVSGDRQSFIDEALRVIGLMPTWEAATLGYESVEDEVTVKVKFKL